MDNPSNTKLRSIGLEDHAPKFLKNRGTQFFKKLAGRTVNTSRHLIPICASLKVNLYKLVFTLLAVCPVLPGQATTGSAKKLPAPTQKNVSEVKSEQTPKPVFDSSLKTDIVILKHRNPMDIMSIVRPLISNSDDAQLYYNSLGEISTITIKDLPDNVDNLVNLIKSLDQPLPEANPIEICLHIVFASKKSIHVSTLPAYLSEIFSSISEKFGYKYFSHGALCTQIIKPNGIPVKGQGKIFFPYDEKDAVFNWTLSDPIKNSETGKLSARFMIFIGSYFGRPIMEISNAYVDLSDDDATVIGTTTLSDIAVMVVLTSKTL
ncbi:MAG: hypothetical protein LBH03_03035 [Holophagales bacterium]|jgi:hypothetical protein|nr:hypothetical protein [Holophagales bacterium]